MPKENIAIGGTDTVTDRLLFYRRESGKTGRMALFRYAKNGSIYIHRFIGFISPK